MLYPSRTNPDGGEFGSPIATLTTGSSANPEEVYVVNDEAALGAAIARANQAEAGENVTILLRDDIALNSTEDLTWVLPLIDTEAHLTIGSDTDSDGDSDVDDGAFAIDGQGEHSMFFIKSGTVELKNLTLANGRARGEDGSGGGAGMGGALFVYSGDVSIDTVTFENNRAIGGRGGDDNDGTGGGIGLGGMRGAGGDAGAAGGKGASGLVGSAGGSGSFGGDGGIGGRGGDGGKGSLSDDERRGNGANGGIGGIGGDGGFGGGGGPGGDGGTGGDAVFGNFGTVLLRAYGGIGGMGGAGGAGGFGGGGGRGGNDGENGEGGLTINPPVARMGGAGRFGGGGGRPDSGKGGFMYYGLPGYGASSDSGDGAGMGGAIFTRTGTLKVENSTFRNNAAGEPGDSEFSASQGFGGAIFAMTDEAIAKHLDDGGSDRGIVTSFEDLNGNDIRDAGETFETIAAPTVIISENTIFENNLATDALNAGQQAIGMNLNTDAVFGSTVPSTSTLLAGNVAGISDPWVEIAPPFPDMEPSLVVNDSLPPPSTG